MAKVQYNRGDLLSQVKAIVTANPDAKSHFTEGNKNVTQLSSEKISSLLEEYNKNAKTTSKVPKPVAPKVEAPEKVVKTETEVVPVSKNVAPTVAAPVKVDASDMFDINAAINDISDKIIAGVHGKVISALNPLMAVLNGVLEAFDLAVKVVPTETKSSSVEAVASSPTTQVLTRKKLTPEEAKQKANLLRNYLGR